MKTYKYQQLTKKIIKGYYEVYNELGTGFLESVYENALKYILNDYGMKTDFQVPIDVYFREKIVGKFRADLIVDDKIIVELKSTSNLTDVHKAQLINYLKATNLEVGLLMNFGNEPEFRRFIFDKE